MADDTHIPDEEWSRSESDHAIDLAEEDLSSSTNNAHVGNDGAENDPTRNDPVRNDVTNGVGDLAESESTDHAVNAQVDDDVAVGIQQNCEASHSVESNHDLMDAAEHRELPEDDILADSGEVYDGCSDTDDDLSRNLPEDESRGGDGLSSRIVDNVSDVDLPEDEMVSNNGDASGYDRTESYTGASLDCTESEMDLTSTQQVEQTRLGSDTCQLGYDCAEADVGISPNVVSDGVIRDISRIDNESQNLHGHITESSQDLTESSHRLTSADSDVRLGDDYAQGGDNAETLQCDNGLDAESDCHLEDDYAQGRDNAESLQCDNGLDAEDVFVANEAPESCHSMNDRVSERSSQRVENNHNGENRPVSNDDDDSVESGCESEAVMALDEADQTGERTESNDIGSEENLNDSIDLCESEVDMASHVESDLPVVENVLEAQQQIDDDIIHEQSADGSDGEIAAAARNSDDVISDVEDDVQLAECCESQLDIVYPGAVVLNYPPSYNLTDNDRNIDGDIDQGNGHENDSESCQTEADLTNNEPESMLCVDGSSENAVPSDQNSASVHPSESDMRLTVQLSNPGNQSDIVDSPRSNHESELPAPECDQSTKKSTGDDQSACATSQQFESNTNTARITVENSTSPTPGAMCVDTPGAVNSARTESASEVMPESENSIETMNVIRTESTDHIESQECDGENNGDVYDLTTTIELSTHVQNHAHDIGINSNTTVDVSTSEQSTGDSIKGTTIQDTCDNLQLSNDVLTVDRNSVDLVGQTDEISSSRTDSTSGINDSANSVLLDNVRSSNEVIPNSPYVNHSSHESTSTNVTCSSHDGNVRDPLSSNPTVCNGNLSTNNVSDHISVEDRVSVSDNDSNGNVPTNNVRDHISGEDQVSVSDQDSNSNDNSDGSSKSSDYDHYDDDSSLLSELDHELQGASCSVNNSHDTTTENHLDIQHIAGNSKENHTDIVATSENHVGVLNATENDIPTESFQMEMYQETTENYQTQHEVSDDVVLLQQEITRLKTWLKERDRQNNVLLSANKRQAQQLHEAKAADASNSQKVQTLESTVDSHQREIGTLKDKLTSHDAAAKRAVATLQNELKLRVDQVTKMYEDVVREKDSMVVKYAQAEQKNIEIRQLFEKADMRVRELLREREHTGGMMKHMTADRQRAIADYERKAGELENAVKEIEKMKEALGSCDVRVRWAQNKHKAELDAHRETHGKLEKMTAKYKEAKEEGEQIRNDTQKMIQAYQHSEEMKSSTLESELQQQKRAKTDKDELHVAKVRELDSLKVQHKEVLEQLKSIKEKAAYLDKERFGLEDEKARNNEIIQRQKKELKALQIKVESMVQLHTDYERAQSMIKSLDQDIKELKLCGKDLQIEIDTCRKRESELLKLTETLSEKNALLQSENTSLNTQVLTMKSNEQRVAMDLQELDTTNSDLSQNLSKERVNRQTEYHQLSEELADKTKQVCELERKLADEQDSIKTIKRKHTNNVKDLTRQLQQAKRRLETLESGQSGGEGMSRTSSIGSLNALGENQMAPAGQANQLTSFEENAVIVEHVEVDQQVLIERIVKLQKMLARNGEKMEFMEDHNRQLVDEIRKKSRVIQNYVLREEAGALSPGSMDENKAQLSKKGGIMSSVYNSHATDGQMSLDLSLEINKKQQAVLEDSLLKNITLKESFDTLGQEIARLSQENRRLQLLLRQYESDTTSR